MATAVFRFDGDRIEYTPSSDVGAGDVVVQGDLVGIATEAIDASVQGSLAVEGVFTVPKAVTSGSALTAGTKVYWDAANEIATTTVGSNKYMGKVVKAAAATTATVDVRLGQA